MDSREAQLTEDLHRFWTATRKNVEQRVYGARFSYQDDPIDEFIYEQHSPEVQSKEEDFNWKSDFERESSPSPEFGKETIAHEYSKYGTYNLCSGGYIINGEITGDVPIIQCIRDLQEQELPVISTYVHPTITPGFKYKVRQAHNDKYLFRGNALNLESIGKGYGKRITFESECKNSNDNYFYSDTNPEGYGFELQLIQNGLQFTIYDEFDSYKGEATVSKILSPEIPIDHQVLENGTIIKKSKVRVLCQIKFSEQLGINSNKTVCIEAIAVGEKLKNKRRSTTEKLINCSIDGVNGLTLKSGIDNTNRPLRVYGSDIKDIPTKYKIYGVMPHEQPVVGTYVDARIMPGFRYKVRALDRKKEFFDGNALELQSIGRGYAKRFTFCSDSMNDNQNYFWSDSNQEGYGFSIEAINPGMMFNVVDKEDYLLGKALVFKTIGSQIEISSEVKNSTIIKRVRVEFSCDFALNGHPDTTLPITGTVVLVKNGRSAGQIECIEEIATEKSISLMFTSRELKFIPC